VEKNKHHYIPKFLLRNFSKENQVYLYRYDLKKILCNSITDAFTKNNLNTLENEKGEKDKNFIEDIYDKYFETKASYSIKKIINDLKIIPPSGKDFSANDYLNLLRFAVLSNFRSPYTLEAAHHSIRVNTYATIYLKYFNDFGTVNFPYELDIPKGWLFSFLDNFDKSIEMLIDLKLTIYYHRIPNAFFILPDQHCIISSPNNIKFGDKDLKMYLPISSNVVVCFERIKRDFFKGTCELTLNEVENFNRYFASNSYESFGCEDRQYLESFISKYQKIVNPLIRFDPYSDFKKEKEQLKFEIISKLAINLDNDNFDDGVIMRIDRNHKLTLLTESQFNKIKKEMNSVVEIKTRQYEM